MNRSHGNLNAVRKLVRPFDRSFGDYLREQGASPAIELAGILASWSLAQGHIALDIRGISPEKIWPDLTIHHDLALAVTADDLRSSPLVGDPTATTPLVLLGSKLYIRRYFQYETTVVEWVLNRIGKRADGIPSVNKKMLSLIKNSSSDIYQTAGTLMPLFSSFSIISGGPGTGKTFSVAKLLAMLVSEQSDLRIALCAPTGKAAQRMNEAMKGTIGSAGFSGIDEQTKERLKKLNATTIHRLLGTRYQSTKFRHCKENPLPIDLLLVDEASMIDLPLMAKLLSAVPQEAATILLGDRNQLASVEVGSIFGDLCQSFRQNSFNGEFLNALQSVLPHTLSASGTLSPVVELRKSYRFSDESEVGRLSRQINDGESPYNKSLREIGFSDTLTDIDLSSYSKTLKDAKDELTALRSLTEGMILTVRNRGRYGQEAINKGMMPRGKRICHNMPIIITQNNRTLNLYNGDIGVVRREKKKDGFTAWFFDENNRPRSFPLEILPAWQTAYAITIHKSQGSEYARIAIILGEKESPLVTKELLYTAVTRVKPKEDDSNDCVLIQGKERLLEAAVKRRVKRCSGIVERVKELLP